MESILDAVFAFSDSIFFFFFFYFSLFPGEMCWRALKGLSCRVPSPTSSNSVCLCVFEKSGVEMECF